MKGASGNNEINGFTDFDFCEDRFLKFLEFFLSSGFSN
jgi:hypothetical protein